MQAKVTDLSAWISVAGLILCLTGCWTPPGKGAKARSGYRAAAPVISALERFHRTHGEYPAELAELVPAYLPDRKELLFRGRVQPINAPGFNATIREEEFVYRRHADTYTLEFSYTGPGMNHCTYDSQTRTWHCHGYY